jgi:hypothetical protein
LVHTAGQPEDRSRPGVVAGSLALWSSWRYESSNTDDYQTGRWTMADDRVREASPHTYLLTHTWLTAVHGEWRHDARTPVAVGRGQHLFEDVDWAPHLKLIDITRFDSGVVILVYAPE